MVLYPDIPIPTLSFAYFSDLLILSGNIVTDHIMSTDVIFIFEMKIFILFFT